MKGYAISAQQKTDGKQTTGGSSAHARMKPGILKGDAKSTGNTVDNKKMYKNNDKKMSY